MLKEVDIVYKDINFCVKGYYIKGRGFINREDPPEYDSFEIIDINPKEDLLNDINWMQLQEIEELCLEKLKN